MKYIKIRHVENTLYACMDMTWCDIILLVYVRFRNYTVPCDFASFWTQVWFIKWQELYDDERWNMMQLGYATPQEKLDSE